MDITATLSHGPLKLELSGEDSEEVKETLLELAQFVEEHEEVFSGVSFEMQGGPNENQTNLGEGTWAEDSGTQTSDSPVAPLANELGVPIEPLEEIVYVDPDQEELPQLLVEGDDIEGGVTDRQRKAAYIILLALETCYDEDELYTSDFKDMLVYADISDNNIYKAWEDAQFDQSGQGRNSKVSFRGPGRREAKGFLKDFIEETY